MKQKIKEKLSQGDDGFRQGVQMGRAMASSDDDMKADTRGAIRIKNVVMASIALGIGALVAAFVVPVGLDEIVNVSNSNYSSGAQSLWDNMDLFVTLGVLGIFIGVMLEVF